MMNQKPELPADLQAQADRLERDAKISPVQPNNTVGSETVGVGQPTTQAVNQGQSLPPVAVPVERKFVDGVEKFYDPQAAEIENIEADKLKSGAEKTPQNI